jgi:hypothetical protein
MASLLGIAGGSATELSQPPGACDYWPVMAKTNLKERVLSVIYITDATFFLVDQIANDVEAAREPVRAVELAMQARPRIPTLSLHLFALLVWNAQGSIGFAALAAAKIGT